MSKVGKSEIRVDAFDKATGRTKYYEDLMPQNALYVRIKLPWKSCVSAVSLWLPATAPASAGTSWLRR